MGVDLPGTSPPLRPRAARRARVAAWAAAGALLVAAGASASPALGMGVASGGTTAAEHAPPSGSGNAAAARLALRYLGVPYVWGGASPSGFDCSGLPSYVYAQIGKSVPHYTYSAYDAFPKVAREALAPGDLVFFNGLGHMGIYIGAGQFVHAPHTGDVVKVTPLSHMSGYVGAVRP